MYVHRIMNLNNIDSQGYICDTKIRVCDMLNRYIEMAWDCSSDVWVKSFSDKEFELKYKDDAVVGK